uniref:Peroxidase n=1 Tax=Cacopsylla melanoneura TaxID=428564 RepID=A0A8D8RDW0_9HEMI
MGHTGIVIWSLCQLSIALALLQQPHGYGSPSPAYQSLYTPTQSPYSSGGYGFRPNSPFYSTPAVNPFAHYSKPVSAPSDVCKSVQLPCTDNKYRTIDGTCNNLKYGNWGTPKTKYGRLLPPKYADGIKAVPTSVAGTELPGARLISIVMFPDLPVDDHLWTLSTMSWAQIITHDMSMSMGNSQNNRYSANCCTDDGQINTADTNPHCFPIIMPDDDPVYSKFNQVCMNFVRSTTDIDQGCNPGYTPAEQMIIVTHWMDASLVYGSDDELAAKLREFNGGRLAVEFRDGKPWPPAAQNKSAVCDSKNDALPCYQFGDRRANQNPGLTVLHIALLREHNRIATILGHLNPHWDDEILYQESRKILIAEYSHINYYEWLPIVVGQENALKYKLIHNTKGYVNDYNDHVEPNVLNEHATAAFRYFHSSVQGTLQLIAESRHILQELRLSDHFNRPELIEDKDNHDNLIRGLTTQSQEEVDPYFTSELTDFLFRNGKPFGRDLRAIDVQRGRDHGLASYNDYRSFCGLPRAYKFEDFLDVISPDRLEKLSALYDHPDDIDLTVGGSLEAHVPGTLAGPTFLCLLLEQFYRTRVSDRYWYEREGQFTHEQLAEIKKASLARLMCDNSDEIHTMQPAAFLKISKDNQLVACNDYEHIPAIDLSYWKEESPYLYKKK